MGYFSEINIFTNITLLKYRQGILQIQIRTAEREPLRFYWVKDQESEKIGTLRFARLVFRLTHSLFVVEGVLNFFFEKDRGIYIETAKTNENDMYVDDLIIMGVTICTICGVKETF